MLWPFKRKTVTGKPARHRIELYKTDGGDWTWRAVAIHNGQVCFTPNEPNGFDSRFNAERSALEMHELYGIEVRGLARDSKGA